VLNIYPEGDFGMLPESLFFSLLFETYFSFTSLLDLSLLYFLSFFLLSLLLLLLSEELLDLSLLDFVSFLLFLCFERDLLLEDELELLLELLLECFLVKIYG